MFSEPFRNRVVVRGAGELASGVINRLSLEGFEVVALEQEHPSCVRRLVCYAEALYEGEVSINGVTAKRADAVEGAEEMLPAGFVPVLIDPDAKSLSALKPSILIDGRLLKRNIDTSVGMAPLVIGLGPGFTAGENCHAAVETNRGESLGQVIYKGSPQEDTGVPAPVEGIAEERVLRAPTDGTLRCRKNIGDSVRAGDRIADVAGKPVVSRIDGIVRGLARDGLHVKRGQKIGDVDPRGSKEALYKISDKAQAVADGVLKAIQHFL